MDKDGWNARDGVSSTYIKWGYTLVDPLRHLHDRPKSADTGFKTIEDAKNGLRNLSIGTRMSINIVVKSIS